MKNIFGMDLTDKKNGETVFINGRNFVTEEIDDSLAEEYESELNNIKKSLTLPKSRSTMKTISGWIAVISGFILCWNIEVLYPEYLLNKALIWKLCFIFFLLLWIILSIIISKSMKANIKSMEFKEKNDKLDEIVDRIKEQLDIPEDAAEVDVMRYTYKIKKDREVLTGLGYRNLLYYIFIKENCLCISNLKCKFSFPLIQITGIRKINKQIPFLYWNKLEPYNDRKYKQYKIIRNNIGIYYCKPYYALQLKDIDKEFEIFIMPYDLEAYIGLLPENCRHIFDI